MKRAGYSLLYLLSLQLLSLLIFFLFRFYLFMDIDYTDPEPISIATKSVAFIRGLWFDNVIACYIMILPITIMWIANFFKNTGRGIIRFCSIYSGTLFSVSFIISAANIPYFKYFFNNINSSIFNWVEYGSTTGGMLFGEKGYYLPLTIGLIIILLYWVLVIRLTRFFSKQIAGHNPLRYNMANIAIITLGGAAIAGLCVFGIRGRAGYNPIKISQAYYCQDPFLNQLGINPTFNLLTSTLDDMRKENRPIELLPDHIAISNAQKLLNRNGIDGISPIATAITAQNQAATKKNVIIIFLESMSARLMQSFGAEKCLTPNLDSLFNNSRSYRNFYSSGIHTNHGLFATLYSHPTIMYRNAMKGTAIPRYSGLPTVLQQNGYLNMFFMTHESQYDNMNAFFRTNGFHEIYAEENYPADKIVNSFGVQDDYLFSYALNVLNQAAEAQQPFFSVILTVSNHPPYIIPDYFKANSKEPNDQIVEYADWSVGQFMNEARKQSWWENTIFVLLGDHGKLAGTPTCEMPQSYNHIPFMIHGATIKSEIIDDLGIQSDIAPTLLDLLGISYIQNNFGINLNKDKRQCAYYTSDKHIASRDTARLYIYEPGSNLEFFYDITTEPPTKTTGDSTFLSLKTHAFSMLQSAQYLSQKKETTDGSDNLSGE